VDIFQEVNWFKFKKDVVHHGAVEIYMSATGHSKRGRGK
jgi:hypothetical protein